MQLSPEEEKELLRLNSEFTRLLNKSIALSWKPDIKYSQTHGAAGKVEKLNKNLIRMREIYLRVCVLKLRAYNLRLGVPSYIKGGVVPDGPAVVGEERGEMIVSSFKNK